MSRAHRIGRFGRELPEPVTVTDTFLAAIFDELQAISAVLAPESPAAEAADEPAPVSLEEPAPATADPEAAVEIVVNGPGELTAQQAEAAGEKVSRVTRTRTTKSSARRSK